MPSLSLDTDPYSDHPHKDLMRTLLDSPNRAKLKSQRKKFSASPPSTDLRTNPSPPLLPRSPPANLGDAISPPSPSYYLLAKRAAAFLLDILLLYVLYSSDLPVSIPIALIFAYSLRKSRVCFSLYLEHIRILPLLISDTWKKINGNSS